MKKNKALEATLRKIHATHQQFNELVETAIRQLEFSSPDTLPSEAAIAFCATILRERKLVPRAADFVKEIKKEGYFISIQKLSSLLSASDRFRYDKKAGGWKLRR